MRTTAPHCVRRKTIAMGLALSGISLSAAAAPVYVITDLGVLNGVSSTANALNDAGQVTGSVDLSGEGPLRAFLWQNGVMTDITPPGVGSATGNGINGGGAVVMTANAGAAAYLRQNDGTISQIANTLLAGGNVGARGINDAGQVAGNAVSPLPTQPPHAFRWQNGVMTDLTPAEPANATANAINGSGQVVGRSSAGAFVWENGTLTTIAGTAFGNNGATAINGVGQVVGGGIPAGSGTHAFLWQNGTLVDLGTLGDFDINTAARGINDAGQIVGTSNGRAFLVTADDTLIDLNTLLDAGSSGFTLLSASAINRYGQIVGQAQIDGSEAFRAYLATPAGTVNWSAGNGFWDDPANWELHFLPGRLLDTVIAPGEGSISVTGPAADTTLRSLTLGRGASLSLAGGGLTVNSGLVVQAGAILDNGAALTLAGTSGNAGVIGNRGTLILQGSLANTGTLTNGGTLTVTPEGLVTGAGVFIQDGGNTSFAGSLQAALLDIRSGTFAFNGSTLQAGQLNNGGTLDISSGTVVADLTNTGTVNLSGGGTRVIDGDVINRGLFKVTDTTVQYTGTFQNDGRYESDPSTNRFNELAVGTDGYLVGGAGDTFVVSGNFRNASTQAGLWNTGNAGLVFSSPATGGAGIHTMELAGADRGAKASAVNNNFAWGSVTLDSGNSLTLTDGNATPGAALYVRRVVLPGGLSQLNSVSSDYNVYFDPTVAANRRLLGGRSFGEGSGRLLPWSFVPALYDAAQAFDLTPNQQSFAAALDEACTRPTGTLAIRCVELQALTPEQKKSAVASLTPDQVPSQTGIVIKFRATRMDAPLDRLARLRSGGTPPLSFSFNGVSIPTGKLARAVGNSARGGAAGADNGTSVLDDAPFRDNPLGIFVQARFNFGDNDYTNFERGFGFETRSVTIGADYRFTDHLVSGLAFNYTSTAAHYAQASGNLDSDSFMGAFYGSYTLPMDFYVDWLANYGGQNYLFNRQYRYPGFSSQTSSKPGGDQYNLSLSTGKDFAWKDWQFSPYVRTEYTNLSVDSYRERGGGGLEVSVAGQTSHSFVSDLGAQISRAISLPFGVITPAVRVEWEHQYLNDNRGIGMRLSEAAPGLGNFTLRTGRPDRDYINLGSSLSAALPYGGAAFLRYETRLGQSDLSQHLVELGIRMQF